MKFKTDKKATEQFQIYINESKNLQNLMKVDEFIVYYSKIFVIFVNFL